MWRHSRWHESDWMIHTVIESAQENSHISAWKCSQTAGKETDCGYWGGCWWYEAHSSANKTFLKEIKMIIVIIYSPPCRYKTIGFSFFNRKQQQKKKNKESPCRWAFIVTMSVKLQKNTIKDLKSSQFNLCIMLQVFWFHTISLH